MSIPIQCLYGILVVTWQSNEGAAAALRPVSGTGIVAWYVRFLDRFTGVQLTGVHERLHCQNDVSSTRTVVRIPESHRNSHQPAGRKKSSKPPLLGAVAWRSGSVEVNLRWAQLVLGWVTVYVTNHPGRLESAFYPQSDGKMSTSQRAVMFCGWEVKAGMV